MNESALAGQIEVSERRYRRLFESAHDGILILDAASGRILDVNPFLLALLGYKAEELVGKQPWEIGIFADIEANKAALKELQEKGEIRYEDLPLQTKDRNAQIDVEFVSNVYQEGEREVIQCNIRDIRTRKASEDAAKLEAGRVARMKDELLAMVSHELRGPLMVVLGWTQALQRSNGDRKDLAIGLDAISRGARTQARLVEDLLDVSRIIFSKLRCECKAVNVAEIVSDAVEDARPGAEEKRIALQWAGATSEAVVNGDAARLRQVFDNILSNAMKFTPDGGAVYVTVLPRDRDVVIQIRDTGRGISSELLPRIFDRFRQSEAGTPNHGGLGLGLAIVKEIVDLHGGTVEAESQAGATFTVTLPLAI